MGIRYISDRRADTAEYLCIEGCAFSLDSLPEEALHRYTHSSHTHYGESS